MVRLFFCCLSITLLLTAARLADAQQPATLKRVGFLNPAGSPSANVQSFYRGMRELGYIDGQNITIDFRTGSNLKELTDLAAELVRQKVDVIVASGPAVPVARAVTNSVPIIFAFSGDPIEAGFIDSLARPGRNMTGITWLAFELVGKRLEILKEAAPRVTRVAILASPAHAGEQRELRETQKSADALKITLLHNHVKDGADVNAALEAAVKKNANALLVFPDPVTNAHRKQITEFAVKRRLPTMFGRKEPVEGGGLLSYGPILEEVYRRIPVHVDKVLKGTNPADIPTELPMAFEFVINLKTAKQIGLTIPQWTLMKADGVIK